MSRDEWFDLPWYEAEVYLEGLRNVGILKGGNEQSQAGPEVPAEGPKEKSIDLASAGLDTLARETGVQVRRAG